MVIQQRPSGLAMRLTFAAMVFSSIPFLAYFLPAFLTVYFAIPRQKAWGQRMRNVWLLLASVAFYAWGAPRFIWVLLASTFIDFYLVRRLARSNGSARKQWLVASLILNLGLLAVFKYAGFGAANAAGFFEWVFRREWPWPLPDIALPIGISFYTFQTLTYALDVYREDEKPLDRLSDYLVYILSFPQMIAGPIVRFGRVARELRHRVETTDDRLLGAYRFSIGLAKKVLIANALAEHADAVFEADSWSTAAAWTGLIAYTFQIYFDFAGYSDMAIGLGRMLGFHFPENFRSPYTARSITEFWRRWHITLGEFMRNYLYIPLGGNRLGAMRTHINLVFVFLMSGLWHGASWNFVVWGAYHGAFLVLDRWFLERWLGRVPQVFSVGLTFLVAMLGWVVFRLETGAWDFYAALAGLGEPTAISPLTPGFMTMVCIATAFSFLTLFSFGKRWEQSLFHAKSWPWMSHIAGTSASLVLLILSLSSIVSAELNPFIYFRF